MQKTATNQNYIPTNPNVSRKKEFSGKKEGTSTILNTFKFLFYQSSTFHNSYFEVFVKFVHFIYSAYFVPPWGHDLVVAERME